jgi:hypothetical protein
VTAVVTGPSTAGPRRGIVDRVCTAIENFFERITPTIDAAAKPIKAVGRVRGAVNALPEKPERRRRGRAITTTSSVAWFLWAAVQPGADFFPNPLRPFLEAPGGRVLFVAYAAVIAYQIIDKRSGGGLR